MTTIGFIGAGIMGAPMMANLAAKGHDVRAIAHSQRSRKRIESIEVTLVPDLASVVDGAEVVITMLPDSPDVRQVVLDDHGLRSLLSPGQLFVDMSTISPETAREIATQLGAQGVPALDAPVSGGEAAAIAGTLSIMVGGAAGALETARPILESMGGTITHVGPAGSGQVTKAANQLIVASNIAALAEAIVFLQSAGVALAPALDAIGGGLAGSTVIERKKAAMLAGDYTPGFRIALHHKDLRIVHTAALEGGLSLPVSTLVAQLVAALVARGDGELDHSALLALLRDLNGGSVPGR